MTKNHLLEKRNEQHEKVIHLIKVSDKNKARVPSKKMGPPCSESCCKKCYEEGRLKFFESYWALGDTKK